MTEDVARIVSGIVVLIIAIACIVYVCTPEYRDGTLYFNDSDAPVCSGRLKKVYHMYSSETYDFECSDGKIINNLTNFTVR